MLEYCPARRIQATFYVTRSQTIGQLMLLIHIQLCSVDSLARYHFMCRKSSTVVHTNDPAQQFFIQGWKQESVSFCSEEVLWFLQMGRCQEDISLHHAEINDCPQDFSQLTDMLSNDENRTHNQRQPSE